MTKPTLTSQISLGNIIQIAVLIVGLAGAFYGLKYTSDAAARDVSDNATEIAQIEARVQELERGAAVDGEQIRVLRRDIEEIKNGQREMNSLLRQLLQRGAFDTR